MVLSLPGVAWQADAAGGVPRQQSAWLYEGPCIAILENPNLSNPPFIGYSGRLVYAQPRDCLTQLTTSKEPST